MPQLEFISFTNFIGIGSLAWVPAVWEFISFTINYLHLHLHHLHHHHHHHQGPIAIQQGLFLHLLPLPLPTFNALLPLSFDRVSILLDILWTFLYWCFFRHLWTLLWTFSHRRTSFKFCRFNLYGIFLNHIARGLAYYSVKMIWQPCGKLWNFS